MPELPEVETVRKTLEPIITGKTVADIDIRYPGIIKEPEDVERFKFQIKGQTFRSIKRLGKFLLFYLDEDVLISHLRMEGKYGLFNEEEKNDAHTHVIFKLDDGQELRYKDVRKFGTMHLKPVKTEFNTPPINKLGLEPFSEEFTVDYLYEKLQKTSRLIKPTLLDQTIVTGLGNIYVDEALFKSQIHPERIASSVSYEECHKLQKAVVEVLSRAVEKGGTSIRSYLNSLGEIGMFQLELAVYDQTGEPCVVCLSPITKTKVGGRGTHFCPTCQVISD
ncbi:formamidopyrimidine-DNA glycosylase [Alkalibacillus filiformis]|uniref:Formamidopyrimidine-DNA glycosylase n=1 Tax=Alkalibacillus filiformis TaxID=200990 RepID=A0ABU0DS11_9BACI|nr:DNA-formamidopyrimidine glycosylase [Alkalibacillus filiformis]MDQ0351225.1 formamidopyrimidine-DNA glycosylase [Alkalibacillus filiformis]